MTIYVDSDYKCHTTDPDGIYTAVETDFFDDRCQEFIEGYRFVPAGESWTRDDGAVFTGEMIAPWKPWQALDAAQREYERQLIADMKAALQMLEVTPDEEVA